MNLKETKKDARMLLSGKWPKALIITLIYLAITLAINYFASYTLSLAQDLPVLKLFIYFVIIAATIPLSYGVTATFLDFSKDKKVNYTDFINKGILSFSKVWSVTFGIFLKVIVPILICIVIFTVFTLICAYNFGITDENILTYQYMFATCYIVIMLVFLVKFLPYALSFIILADNPELSSKEILNKSAELMQNRKLEYFTLCLSFLGWILLITLVCVFASIALNSTLVIDIIGNIGTIILAPYVLLSQIVYYQKAQDTSKIEEQIKKED